MQHIGHSFYARECKHIDTQGDTHLWRGGRRLTVVDMPPKKLDTENLPARVSIQQAALFLGLSEKTIRRWIADGHIKAYRLGARTIRVDRESLLALQKPMGPYYGN